jgi:hypothetical protein
VPAPDAQIEVKDAGTGAKVQRPWPEAVALVKAGQAEFVDKSLKYAVLKMEQQPVAASSAFAQPAQPSEDPAEREVRYTIDGQALLKTALEQSDAPTTSSSGRPRTASREDGPTSGSCSRCLPRRATAAPAPPTSRPTPSWATRCASVRDPARRSRRRAHDSPVAVDGEVVKPKRRWQRELGPAQRALGVDALAHRLPTNNDQGRRLASRRSAQNGHGDGPVVQTERLPAEVERVSERVEGRHRHPREDRPARLLLAADRPDLGLAHGRRRRPAQRGDDRGPQGARADGRVEAFEAMDVTEYIARHQRGELVSFLESTGALKQPVS